MFPSKPTLDHDTPYYCISHKVDDVSSVLDQLQQVGDIRTQALEVCINFTTFLLNVIQSR